MVGGRAGPRRRRHRSGAQGRTRPARRVPARPRSAGDGRRQPRAPWRFSAGLHCPDCDISYKDPSPSTFSFNSPIGACETCRGFGRIIGVDYGLVIPDAALSLREGAIKPWQTDSYKECQTDLVKFARKRGIPDRHPLARF